MTEFVDWDLAAATARTTGRSGPAISLAEATEVVHQLRERAVDASDHVAEYTGLRPSPQPPIRVVDRGDWAQANILGLKDVMGPLAEQMSGEPGRLTKMVGSRVAGTQAGVVLGYLSSKVLGQYEVFGREKGQLLIVAPNVVEVERELEVSTDDFRLWVCIHEATHSAQFGAVPWLRDHFMSEVAAFGTASKRHPDDPGPNAAEAVASAAYRFVEQVRKTASVLADSTRDTDSDTSIIDLMTSDKQREVMDRLTALMTLLEGHADYVMDGVGPQVVPSVDVIRERFDRRRHAGGLLQRLVRRLLGMDVKLKQYVQGKEFAKTVIDARGMDGFNLVWESPQNLPTLEEINEPQRWIARVTS